MPNLIIFIILLFTILLFPFGMSFIIMVVPLQMFILNTFMFIPFGFLVPLSFQYSFIKTMLIGLMTIIGIESLQMIFSLFCIGFRTFDITDIITNFIGLCLGYLIYYIDKKRQCFVK